MGSGQLETSDMNDGDILAKTTQVPCKGGHQFKFILPDGHPIISECVNAENKARALHLWVDVVKSSAVARVRAEREELAAKIRREKADAEAEERDRQALIVPEGTSAPSSVAASPVTRFVPSVIGAELVPSSAPSSPGDPVAMARGELVRAALEVQQLQPQLAAAQQRVAQWQAVLNALQAVELPKESAVILPGSNIADHLEKR